VRSSGGAPNGGGAIFNPCRPTNAITLNQMLRREPEGNWSYMYFSLIDPNATNGKNPLSAQSTSIGPDQQHLCWCRTQMRAFGAIRSCQRIREERLNRLALVGKVPRDDRSRDRRLCNQLPA
jgi:hypothetical protein